VTRCRSSSRSIRSTYPPRSRRSRARSPTVRRQAAPDHVDIDPKRFTVMKSPRDVQNALPTRTGPAVGYREARHQRVPDHRRASPETLDEIAGMPIKSVEVARLHPRRRQRARRHCRRPTSSTSRAAARCWRRS
jgi:hypothetical protein